MKFSSKMKKTMAEMNKKTAGMLLIIMIAAFLCSRYWIQVVLVQGNSMEPTIHPMQFIMIDKMTNSFSKGDIIVFQKSGIKGSIVKRIVAGPGDTVIIQNGTLFVNGEAQSDERRIIQEAGRAESEISLRKNRYFVMGDNVNNSIDSRFVEIGDVWREEILGKVILIK